MNELQKKLAAILAKLQKFEGQDNYTETDMEEINALHADHESLTKQIEALEKIEAMKKTETTSKRQVAPIEAKVEVGQDRRVLDPKAGFQSSGEFFKAVHKAASGNIDKRLNVQAGAMEKEGMDGGFLIPVDFRQDIQKKVQGDDSLLPLTRQFQTSSNNLVLPTNEVAPWDGTGIQAYWEAEGGAFTDTKAKFGETALRLHKLTAMVRVTEELLEDAPALESWVKAEAPAAMLHKVNTAIISGTGVGQPAGILNSAFKFKVSKESGQAADTVRFENVNKMLGRILPQSFQRAIWIVNPAVLPELRAMKFDISASSPVPVYMPPSGLAEAPYGTLYGRPVMPMMGGVKALGDEGDLMLVDLSYYFTAVKTAGIKQDISTHVYFSTQEAAFRFSMRIAGHCPYKAPVTTENGNFQMSAFVTLEDR